MKKKFLSFCSSSTLLLAILLLRSCSSAASRDWHLCGEVVMEEHSIYSISTARDDESFTIASRTVLSLHAAVSPDGEPAEELSVAIALDSGELFCKCRELVHYNGRVTLPLTANSSADVISVALDMLFPCTEVVAVCASDGSLLLSPETTVTLAGSGECSSEGVLTTLQGEGKLTRLQVDLSQDRAKGGNRECDSEEFQLASKWNSVSIFQKIPFDVRSCKEVSHPPSLPAYHHLISLLPHQIHTNIIHTEGNDIHALEVNNIHASESNIHTSTPGAVISGAGHSSRHQRLSRETSTANRPPVFSEGSFEGSVLENSAVGTVVDTVVARDDQGDTVTYSMMATGLPISDTLFEIDAATGTIRTKGQKCRGVVLTGRRVAKCWEPLGCPECVCAFRTLR